MCHVMLPSPAALIEHMNKNHFRCFVNICWYISNEIVPQGSGWAEHCTARCATATKLTQPSISWYPILNTQILQHFYFAVSPREPQQASRGPSLTPAQAKALSLSKTPTGPNVGVPRPSLGPARSPIIQHRMQAPPGQPPSKVARSENMQGVSFSRPTGNASSPAEELLEEGSKEKSIRKEVEGLQTLELLDNLVNFLNDA